MESPDAGAGMECEGDECELSPCEQAEASRSNIGCEYWAVPLANVPDLPGRYDFRVVIANANAEDVRVEIFRGGTRLTEITVGAESLDDIVLPWITGMSDGFDNHTGASSLATEDGAYRLVSTLPVTMTQFNPFEYNNGQILTQPLGARDFSLSNDASLLLPKHTLTGDYIAASMVPLSRRTKNTFGVESFETAQWPGYVAIVGVEREPTMVEVELTAPVAAELGRRFEAADAGETLRFEIRYGEVIHLVSALPPHCTEDRPGFDIQPLCAAGNPGCGNELQTCNEVGHDLTGSRIRAEGPVAVFGGHVCAYVPYRNEACDHLESQMPPLQTWGKEFVSGAVGNPDAAPSNIVRVTAAFDGTTIEIDPPQNGTSTLELDANEWHELEVSGAFAISASEEIMVVQYLVGQTASDPEQDNGDPSMFVLPPREQHRSQYTFVTPTSYTEEVDGQSYALIARPVGVELAIDGSPVDTTWTVVGDREIGVVPLQGGTHSLDAAHPIGIIVYGMGVTTSYAYPAGLNLDEILLI